MAGNDETQIQQQFTMATYSIAASMRWRAYAGECRYLRFCRFPLHGKHAAAYFEG